jgi:hypothetical protein
VLERDEQDADEVGANQRGCRGQFFSANLKRERDKKNQDTTPNHKFARYRMFKLNFFFFLDEGI